ncbi:MAG TPA: sulfite exporter TauE/SafE family protein [candidate division Zixibacteria bacterium]|nr:sulfite exporter TauE/SafE family protein [candidate division Zixibacteria bacterium]
MPTSFLALALVGFSAQLVDGALGMAYGVTSTSLLLTVGVVPAAASASVHIAEVGTTLASGISHWRLGNLTRLVVIRLAIPGAIGAFLGAVALSNLSADVARPLVSLFLAGLGVLLLVRFGFRSGRVVQPRHIPSRALAPLGFVGGFMDAAGGGGWGPIVTPALMASGRIYPRKAVGNTDASEFAVALAASIGFFVALDLSEISLGLVAAMLLGGVLAAPMAAWLVRRLPSRILGVAVSGVIILTNGPRALDSLSVPDVAELAILGALGVAWLAAMVVVLLRRRPTPAAVRE